MAADIVRRFESMTEFIAYAEPEQPSQSSHENSAGHSWDLGVGWSGALDLAKHGWSESRPDTDSLVENLTTVIQESLENAFETVTGPIGGEVDMGLYLEGNPECMIGFHLTEHEAQREIVRIVVSTTCSAGESADIVRRRGIAICALVDLIARTGRAVELWAEDSVGVSRSGATGRHVTLVKVKEADSYLDIDQVMYAMAHPSFQRRLTFAAQEQETMEVRRDYGFTHGGGYGGSSYHSYKHILVGPKLLNAQVAIGTLDGGREFRTIDGMIQWIKEQLKDLGLLKEGQS